jgi:nicotinamide phosphoribosyltransferase
MTISSQRLMAFLEIYWTDVYKVGHKFMLPTGSYLMYSNFTPRSGKLSNVKNSKFVISAGQQKMVRAMKHDWDVNFFERPVEEIYQFGRDITEMLMLETPFDVSHFVALHELGYLPICVKAIPEGLKIPYKVPLFTVYNTHPVSNMVFDWLVNYLETIGSAESWLTPTSATTAYAYRQLGLEWAQKTDPENLWFVDYQFHDFSMRGMGGKSAIINSGLGFAMCSRGSDTLPVIPAARMYYDEEKPCINSVIATEHAIMCTLTGFYLKTEDGSWDNVGALEVETFRELLRRFPTGILSIVSDTWDLWRVITDYCRKLKNEIMARNGKLVIRPDSGDPVDIVCGLNTSTEDRINHPRIVDGEISASGNIRFVESGATEAEWDGLIETLWNIFGGTITSKGYKKLDSHIGAIYGDSITLERAENIFNRLAAKGFASTNIVLGVGSYSLQYVTRDTHGFAQKATYVEIKFMNGHNETFIDGIEIFKDPATDVGKTKKSARGLIAVHEDENGELYIKDQCTWEEEKGGIMQVIFENGEFFNQTTLTEIRKRIGMAV